MTVNRQWYNFPIYRSELDNMIAAIVGTAMATSPDEQYMAGFLTAAQAIATAAGLYYELPPEATIVVEKVRRSSRNDAPPAPTPMRLTGPWPR